jgi:hypothetical protein
LFRAFDEFGGNLALAAISAAISANDGEKGSIASRGTLARVLRKGMRFPVYNLANAHTVSPLSHVHTTS